MNTTRGLISAALAGAFALLLGYVGVTYGGGAATALFLLVFVMGCAYVLGAVR